MSWSNASFLGLAIPLFWIALELVAGQPTTFQVGSSGLRPDYYGPMKPIEPLPEYLDARDDDDATEPLDRNRVRSTAVRSTRFHVSDASSGADKFVKRNIDEIDRTAFDDFFKRNIDEIDRVGWTGFSKRRVADYGSADGTIEG